jgi:Rrf2 family protein
MFRLSRRADHATRLLLELAVAEGGQLTAEEAARRSGVPLPYFRKSLAGLVSAGLVVTHPGPGGGLTLARPAAEITMLDVIEALEGAICLNACLLRPAECPRDRICPAHSFWGRLQLLVIAELRAATLEALAKEYPALRLQPRPKGQVHLGLQAAVSPQRSPIPAGVHPDS